MNPMLILSGIGMMLVGILPVIYWMRKKDLGKRFFAAGAFIWVIAIVIKVIMDLTITGAINSYLLSEAGILGALIFGGAYVGIRTGLIENGLSYIGIRKYDHLSDMDFDESVAFGLGFGCIEAFIIGLSSFAGILFVMVFPGSVPAAAVSAFDAPTITIFAGIIERISTVMIHLACSLLIVYATKTNRIIYFLYAFFYKTALDGIVPFIAHNANPKDAYTLYMFEIPILLLGALSLWILPWIRDKMKEDIKPKKEDNKKKSIAIILSVFIALAVSSIIFFAASPDALSGPERPEYRNPLIGGIEGRYDFFEKGEPIGYYEYSVSEKTEYNGVPSYIMSEYARIESSGHEQEIEGVLYISEEGFPLYYNSSIIIDGKENIVLVDFTDNPAKETVIKMGSPTNIDIPLEDKTFILANNMAGQMSVIFRSIELAEEDKSYQLNIFSPNSAKALPLLIKKTTKKNIITIRDTDFDTTVYTDSLRQKHYVTDEGTLIKITQGNIEMIMDIF